MNGLDEYFTDEDGPAIVFHCRTGKGRTTTAMAIACERAQQSGSTASCAVVLPVPQCFLCGSASCAALLPVRQCFLCGSASLLQPILLSEFVSKDTECYFIGKDRKTDLK